MNRSSLGAAGRDTLMILGCALVLGVVCGVLWWLVVDPPSFTKVPTGGSMGEVEILRQFDRDGWYAVIAGAAGILGGIALTWWRARDFVLTTLLLTVGALLAAAAMAGTGRLLGPGNPDAALAAAARGDQVPLSLEVTASTTYLVWPIAMLVGALTVLWSQAGFSTAQSRPRELRHE